MNFRLPEAAWNRVEDVCKNWKTTPQELLKFAASGALQLHAFATPYGVVHYKKQGRQTAWVPTTPIHIAAETAGLLIHERFVELKEWQTKDGEEWELSFGNPGPHISVHNLIVYRDERQRFEGAHAEQSAQPATVEQTLSETERTRLLKQIGALAMLLSEKSSKLQLNGRPNANQISENVGAMLDAWPDANRRGVVGTNLRDSIKEGLGLLGK